MILGILLICFLSTSRINALQFHERFIDKWKNLPNTLERDVYRQLKKKPIKNNVSYFAAPWQWLSMTHNVDKVHDVKLNEGFTVSQSDMPEQAIPDMKKIGIKVLFTPNASKNIINLGITIVPCPYVAMNEIKPKQKNIWYSFIGTGTSHPIRDRIFKMQHPSNVVIKQRDRWHWHMSDKVKQEREKKEYIDILSRSRFSLCPRGFGVGSIRFWESLSAGAIPIVISDDLLLPFNFNWNLCSIRVAEKDVEHIPEILKKISRSQENKMRIACLKVYKLFSHQNLTSVISNYYSTK